MGDRGPAAKPDSLKQLQGNPGKRPLNKKAPKFDLVTGLPKPPGHLNRYGKHEWNRIIPVLQKVSMLTEADLTSLAAYCQAYGTWVEAEKLKKAMGLTTTTDKGNVIQRPEVGIANTSMANMISIAKEFGMTPASRTKVEVEETETQQDPFVKFITINGGKSGKR